MRESSAVVRPLCVASVLALSGCALGLGSGYSISAGGDIEPVRFPQQVSQVESLRAPKDLEDTYRLLMLRCAGAEAENHRASRRTFGLKVALQVASVLLGTAATTLVSVNEVRDGGAFSEETRADLKIAGAALGGGAVLSSSILAIVGYDARVDSTRRLLQLIRQTRDRVRIQWHVAGASRPALLEELSRACSAPGMLEAGAARTGPSVLEVVRGQSELAPRPPKDPKTDARPAEAGDGQAATTKQGPRPDKEPAPAGETSPGP